RGAFRVAARRLFPRANPTKRIRLRVRSFFQSARDLTGTGPSVTLLPRHPKRRGSLRGLAAHSRTLRDVSCPARIRLRVRSFFQSARDLTGTGPSVTRPVAHHPKRRGSFGGSRRTPGRCATSLTRAKIGRAHV